MSVSKRIKYSTCLDAEVAAKFIQKIRLTIEDTEMDDWSQSIANKWENSINVIYMKRSYLKKTKENLLI